VSLTLLLLIVALVLAGVSVVQAPRATLPWAVLVLCIALLLGALKL
jgi:hypothetical protein